MKRNQQITSAQHQQLLQFFQEASCATNEMLHALETVPEFKGEQVDQLERAVREFHIGTQGMVDLIAGKRTQFQISVREELLANVLCSGIESGAIRSWCSRVEYVGKGFDQRGVFAKYLLPFNDGAIEFTESRTEVIHTLDHAALIRGVQAVLNHYPHHVGAVLGGHQQDAVTGNVLIQCALFDEVVYD